MHIADRQYCQDVQLGMFAKNLLNIQHENKLYNIYCSAILTTVETEQLMKTLPQIYRLHSSL